LRPSQHISSLAIVDRLRDDTIAGAAMTTWLEPWMPVSEADGSPLLRELRAELPRNHALYGRDAKAIARRVDNDDVLFAIASPSQLAVVHLTYGSHPEKGPDWPETRLFDTFADFVAQCMQPDYEAFGAGDG
jgi:hypothetical protein